MIWVFSTYYYDVFVYLVFEGGGGERSPPPPSPQFIRCRRSDRLTSSLSNWTLYNTVIVLVHRSNPRVLEIALLNRRSDNRERDFRQLLSFGRQFPVISCRLLRHELSVSGGIMQSVGARLSWRPSTFARSPGCRSFRALKGSELFPNYGRDPPGMREVGFVEVTWRAGSGADLWDFSSHSRTNYMIRLTVAAWVQWI